jgi:hypothetical protein
VSDDGTPIYAHKVNWRSTYYLHMLFSFTSLCGWVYALCISSVVSCDQERVCDVHKSEGFRLLHLLAPSFIHV